MSERYTDFQDPFDLLTSLHNTRLRMVYQNEFARGDRTDMTMGFRSQPSSRVGRMAMAQDRLPVNAPVSQIDRSGTARFNRPSAPRISARVDFGTPTTINRYEFKRLGSTAVPLATSLSQTFKSLGKIREKNREEQEVRRSEELQARISEATSPFAQEMVGLEEEISKRKQMLDIGKGLLEFRRNTLSGQVQQSQVEAARSRADLATEEEKRKNLQRQSLNVIARNIPEATTETLSKVPGISPYGMLRTPDETRAQRISQAMGSLFNEPGLPPPSTMGAGRNQFDVPWSSTIPIGASEPIPPFERGINTSTLLATPEKKKRSGRKKLPPPPPPKAPTMPPPSALLLPPPPSGKGTKSPKGTKSTPKGSKTNKNPKSS